MMNKVRRAIELLRAFAPPEGYYLCYSGGKDSDCIRILAQLAGVRHELHHSVTSVDAPETMQYIKTIPGIIFDRRYHDGHPVTMWNLIPRKKVVPTRIMRYCCTELKEHGGAGRLKVMGVRKAESVQRRKNGGTVKVIGKPATMRRMAEEMGVGYDTTPAGGLVLNHDNAASRRMVEHCYRTTSTMVNPIVDWTDEDVWTFLRHYGCESNPLYQCGHSRIGCIGCPMASRRAREREFLRHPVYKDNYLRAFQRMIDARDAAGMRNFYQTPEEVFARWMGLYRRASRTI